MSGLFTCPEAVPSAHSQGLLSGRRGSGGLNARLAACAVHTDSLVSHGNINRQHEGSCWGPGPVLNLSHTQCTGPQSSVCVWWGARLPHFTDGEIEAQEGVCLFQDSVASCSRHVPGHLGGTPPHAQRLLLWFCQHRAPGAGERGCAAVDVLRAYLGSSLRSREETPSSKTPGSTSQWRADLLTPPHSGNIPGP